MKQSPKTAPKTVVALYHRHYNLPFGISPENPYALFCPDRHKNFIVENYTSKDKLFKRQGLADSHYMFPVLEGLHNLSLPNVMAHISINFDGKTKNLSASQETWIQLTTEPHDWRQDEISLPIIMTKDGRITVESLCPQFKDIPGEETPAFWTNFFLNELKAERAAAQKTYTEARHLVRLLNSILK